MTLTDIVLQTAVPVFLLMAIGIYLTYKEFKNDLDNQKEEDEKDEKDEK